MPDFWQFPTGSMGIGPIPSTHQARFMRYLQHRQMLDPRDRKVDGTTTCRWWGVHPIAYGHGHAEVVPLQLAVKTAEYRSIEQTA